jgi:excisionase family DNA binding protein
MNGPWPEKLAFVIDEAAHASGVSRRMLERAMAAGHLRFYRAGGRRRILPDDLKKYLMGQHQRGS